MSEVLTKLQKTYEDQFKQLSEHQTKLEAELAATKVNIERLRGAVFALQEGVKALAPDQSSEEKLAKPGLKAVPAPADVASEGGPVADESYASAKTGSAASTTEAPNA
jgi:peptidoglycan hydrolase CwlO-like protein